QRGVFADLHAGKAGEPEASVRRADQVAAVVLGHARLQCPEHGLIALQRDVTGEPHQIELMLILDHAAAGGDRRRARDVETRRRNRDAVGEHELRRLLDAEPSGRDAAILQTCATRSNGLSSSCQMATSVCSIGPPASCSRVRSSSNPGVTMYGLPTLGMI